MQTLTAPRAHVWTRRIYAQLIALGIFDAQHVELIEGHILDMTPMGSLHATAVALTANVLEQAFGTGYFVRWQMPFGIGELSEPEPDVAVVQGNIRDYVNAHPTTAALIVEISDTSLDFDRTQKAGLYAMRTAYELEQPERIILGTDSPAGSGVQPLGILRVIAFLSSFGDVPAETAFCYATGNTARLRGLDCGLIEVGRAADFVLMDRAQHSAGRDLLECVRIGDLPGIGMVIIDGVVRAGRSRNTPPAETIAELVQS